jgi:cobalt/nickel transport system permease protein
MLRARAARSGVSGEPGRKVGGTVIWRARVAGAMAGSLFLRAIERGDRIYLAMASRGYDGEIRAFPLPAIPRAQWVVLFGALIILVLLLGLSILF